MGSPLNSPLSFFLNHVVDPDRAYAIFAEGVDTCLPKNPDVHTQGYPAFYMTMQWTEPNPAWQGWQIQTSCIRNEDCQFCVNPYHSRLNKLERAPKSRQVYRGSWEDWLEWEYEEEYPDRQALFVACLEGDIPAFANVYTLAQYRRQHAEAEGPTGILYKPRTANQAFRRWEGKQVSQTYGTGSGETER